MRQNPLRHPSIQAASLLLRRGKHKERAGPPEAPPLWAAFSCLGNALQGRSRSDARCLIEGSQSTIGWEMTEEDSESVATDSQTEEDSDLPVIQLCGLVEELRYRHRGPLRPQRQPANHPGRAWDTAHYGGEGTSLPGYSCFCLLLSWPATEGARTRWRGKGVRWPCKDQRGFGLVCPWCPAAALPSAS